jgi:hypothetical protein
MKSLKNPPRTPERVPTRLRLFCDDGGGIRLEAAMPLEGDKPPLRRFTMTAYTGGAMQLAGWRYPVVVDLAGLRISKKSRPILKDHNPGQIVGHTDEITVAEQTLEVAGVISGIGATAQEIIATSENGFPWQASIGAVAEKVVFITDGKTATANGREFTGPVYIARKSTLGEVSFVALGADDDTYARVAAEAGQPHLEVTTMEFDAWAEQHGFNVETLDERNRASLQAMFAEPSPPAPVPAPVSPPVPPTPATPPAPTDQRPPDVVAQVQSDAAAELKRIRDIHNLCLGHFPDIEARAVAEGWDVTKTELAVLRASRPQGPAIIGVRPDMPSAAVLEAACFLSAGLQNVEQTFDAATLEAADRRFRGSIGLQELLLEAAWANGYTGRNFRDARAVLRFAFRPNIEAGFSTIDIGGILSNVANKFLLEGFFSVERTWRNICAVRNVSDFKTVTSYRLIGKDQYEQVAPGGELKHGTLGNETYTNKADTYGLILSIDRRDIINDDLGAITTVPRKLGRGSGLKINDIFWATFLDSAAFFVAGNHNYLTGADTALSIDGLTKAEVAFMDQVDSDGKPIGIMPAILLVPTALSAVGTQLYKSMELRDTTASTKYPVNNPHQGKFRVEVSRYLSNSYYTGYSAKAWYLLADPNDLPVIEVAFLNGQESPTIETAEADFSVLGIQARGIHDFGVSKQDPRAGIRAKGEA